MASAKDFSGEGGGQVRAAAPGGSLAREMAGAGDLDPPWRRVVGTRAMARERVMIDPSRGGVGQVPGWLDFSYDPSAFRDMPSGPAVSEVFGSDPDAPLVPAR